MRFLSFGGKAFLKCTSVCLHADSRAFHESTALRSAFISAGTRFYKALCGLDMIVVSRQHSSTRRASAVDANTCTLKHSSRRHPLKRSMNPFPWAGPVG